MVYSFFKKVYLPAILFILQQKTYYNETYLWYVRILKYILFCGWYLIKTYQLEKYLSLKNISFWNIQVWKKFQFVCRDWKEEWLDCEDLSKDFVRGESWLLSGLSLLALRKLYIQIKWRFEENKRWKNQDIQTRTSVDSLLWENVYQVDLKTQKKGLGWSVDSDDSSPTPLWTKCRRRPRQINWVTVEMCPRLAFLLFWLNFVDNETQLEWKIDFLN